jgi:hypothetical protein
MNGVTTMRPIEAFRKARPMQFGDGAQDGILFRGIRMAAEIFDGESPDKTGSRGVTPSQFRSAQKVNGGNQAWTTFSVHQFSGLALRLNR